MYFPYLFALCYIMYIGVYISGIYNSSWSGTSSGGLEFRDGYVRWKNETQRRIYIHTDRNTIFHLYLLHVIYDIKHKPNCSIVGKLKWQLLFEVRKNISQEQNDCTKYQIDGHLLCTCNTLHIVLRMRRNERFDEYCYRISCYPMRSE